MPEPSAAARNFVMKIPADRIEPNKFNPNVMSHESYAALKADILRGDYDPIVVSPKNVFYSDNSLPRDRYVIVDGEHRWRGCLDLGISDVACNIWLVTETEAMEINYRRNRERGTLDPLKEAKLFKRKLEEENLTQDELAERMNLSRSYIAGRLSLTNLDEKVVDLFNKGETYEKYIEEREKKLRPHLEPEELEEEEEELEEEEWEEEEPEPERFVPRGTISVSHLEVLAALPKEVQRDMAAEILDRELNVRETERESRFEKEKFERRQRFQEALTRAKMPKCPVCGAEPDDFYYNDETRFSCSAAYHNWDYRLTKEELEQKIKEDEERGLKYQMETAKSRVETLQKARENPGFITLPQTPQELQERVQPWVLTKVLQLTVIERVNIRGKRGEEEVVIEFDPPGEYGFGLLNLDFRVGGQYMQDPKGKSFGFNVEAKEYKRSADKSRVNIKWPEPSEETRERLRRFFEEIVKTDKDPWEEAER